MGQVIELASRRPQPSARSMPWPLHVYRMQLAAGRFATSFFLTGCALVLSFTAVVLDRLGVYDDLEADDDPNHFVFADGGRHHGQSRRGRAPGLE